jgi:hypothetical protein
MEEKGAAWKWGVRSGSCGCLAFFQERDGILRARGMDGVRGVLLLYGIMLFGMDQSGRRVWMDGDGTTLAGWALGWVGGL